MAPLDESYAAALGDRLRLARSALGIRQSDVAIQAGVSRTMVGRIERGRGGSICLDSWAAVARVLDVDLVAVVNEPDGSWRSCLQLRCHELVAAAARDGGWAATTEIIRASRDCAPSSVETILVRPFRKEAAVIHAWHPVPNVGTALAAFEARTTRVRRSLGSGWAVSALVVCPSTTAVRRRVTELAPRLAMDLSATSGEWMAALRYKHSPMPAAGLLWTDRWAERFRPAGRHPGWQRPV